MSEKGIRILTWTVQPDETAASKTTASETTADGAAAGGATTVEHFLRAKGCSHHVLMQLKRTDGGILRNGEPVFTNRPLLPGDTLSIRIAEAADSKSIKPVSLPLAIVYEDEDLLVVDKPSDMPVHPSMGNYENTLANAVMYYYASRGIPFTFRCVTRLDRDTTGLVLIAKNMLSSAILSDMSAKRQIHREYLAVTEGELPENGTVDAPIARAEGSPLLRCVNFEKGERAVTHYQRLGVFTGSRKLSIPEASALPDVFSLASVTLGTGRTHQIRVHMNYIGHPLPGDFLYNPDTVCPLAPRQMLHSHRLSFAHPITGEMLSFESKLPQDMRQLLDAYEFSGFSPGTQSFSVPSEESSESNKLPSLRCF
ncbi:MAG: RluA family pseudouridine synthase [Lachnospiraceae bacterium]|nr:RluA family pseudouridine synthase [Lachnospiraceae bacterium]